MKFKLLFLFTSSLFIKSIIIEEEIQKKRQKIIDHHVGLLNVDQLNKNIEEFKATLLITLPEKFRVKIHEIFKNISKAEDFLKNEKINALIFESELNTSQKETLISPLNNIRKSIHKNIVNQKRISYLKNTKDISSSKFYYLMQFETLKKNLLERLASIWYNKDRSIETTIKTQHGTLNKENNTIVEQLNLNQHLLLQNQDQFNLFFDLIIASINTYSKFFIYPNQKDNELTFTVFNTHFMFPAKFSAKLFKSDIFQTLYEKNKSHFQSYSLNKSIEELEKYNDQKEELDNLRTLFSKNKAVANEIYVQGLKELNNMSRYPVNSQFLSENEPALKELIDNIFEQIAEEYIEKKCENLNQKDEFFDFLCLTNNNFQDSSNNFLQKIHQKEIIKQRYEYLNLEAEHNKLQKENAEQHNKITNLTNTNNSKKKEILVVSGMILTVFIAWLFFHPKEELQKDTDSKN